MKYHFDFFVFVFCKVNFEQGRRNERVIDKDISDFQV